MDKDRILKNIKEYKEKYGVAQESHKKGQCSTCDALRVMDKIQDLVEVQTE